jgi:tetratricopeptide (TPR) repeat protein
VSRVGRVLVGALLAANVAGAEPAWTRVTGPHFVVSGDTKAEDVREVAFLLEMFRDVFLRVLPGARDRSLVPPFVVVFGSEKTFAPYKPVYSGKPAPVAGYTVYEPMAPLVALRLDQSRGAFRTIFHEYTHVLFDAPTAPLWLSEGVADYYSTATVSRDRRHVLVGGNVPGHLAQLSRRWMPLRQVLGTTRAARNWDEVTAQSFYAESWALVHYLTRATPGRGSQLARLLEAVAGGESEAAAFERLIGSPARVEAELRRYVRNGIAPPEEVMLPAQVGLQPLRERSMSPAEVEATLGRVLYQLQRDDEALVRLGAAASLDPQLAEAQMTLGLLRLRQNRPHDAIAPFRAASAADPQNALVAYNFALVSLQAADGGADAPLEAAATALERVIRRDGPSEPLAVLGTALGRLGRLDEAEALLRRAGELAPAKFPTQVELADACLRLGKFDDARSILKRLAVTAERDQIDIVDQRRHWLALAEERAALRADLAAAAGTAAPGRDPGLAQTGRFPLPPELRQPAAGEQRAAGLIQALDCTNTGIVVHVRTRDGLVSLAAASLGQVHLASARPEIGGTLSCGPRPAREAVYVTWASGRRLVALEFLPVLFQPDR